MKLIIGIVNWNTKELLEKCLCSLSRQKKRFSNGKLRKFSNKKGFDFVHVIVDNASEDGSVGMVKKKFPTVTVIQNNKNHGMAAGLNQIIKKYHAEYYLFLHPDTEVKNGVVKDMVAYLDAHPEVGIIGPHLVYPNGENFASCHRFPTLCALFLELFPISLAKALSFHGLYLRSIDYSKTRNVDIIASACFLVRKKCLAQCGVFDERFTSWMAEWDLCIRAKRNGWKIRYVPLGDVIHCEGQAEARGEKLLYKRYSYVIADKMLSSLFLFYRKHYSSFSLAVLKAAVFLGLGAKILFYLPGSFLPSGKEARARVKAYVKTMEKYRRE